MFRYYVFVICIQWIYPLTTINGYFFIVSIYSCRAIFQINKKIFPYIYICHVLFIIHFCEENVIYFQLDKENYKGNKKYMQMYIQFLENLFFLSIRK